MKKYRVLIILLLALAIATPAYALWTMYPHNSGEMLDAYVLPGGRSIVVTLQEDRGMLYFNLTYQIPESWTQERVMLPIQTAPDRVYIGVCGSQVTLFANWLTDYDLNSAPVYAFTFELPEDTGRCDQEVHRIYIPLVEVWE